MVKHDEFARTFNSSLNDHRSKERVWIKHNYYLSCSFSSLNIEGKLEVRTKCR